MTTTTDDPDDAVPLPTPAGLERRQGLRPFAADVEVLARILHESGREAVEKRKIYRDDLPVKPFAEWDDLHEAAKEGRRMMARYVIDALPGIRGLLP